MRNFLHIYTDIAGITWILNIPYHLGIVICIKLYRPTSFGTKSNIVLHYSKMNGSNQLKNKNLRNWWIVRLHICSHLLHYSSLNKQTKHDEGSLNSIQSNWDNTDSPVMYMNNKVLEIKQILKKWIFKRMPLILSLKSFFGFRKQRPPRINVFDYDVIVRLRHFKWNGWLSRYSGQLSIDSGVEGVP